MRHDDCGTQGKRSLSALRGGRGGCKCSIVATAEQAETEVLEAGYTPIEQYPGRTDKPWTLQCNDCGYTAPRQLRSIRDKRACYGCMYLAADVAVAILTEHGYTPLGEYPGSKKTPWKVRCDRCGWDRPRSLDRIMQGHGCRSCMGWLVRADDVEQRVRDAGFEPSVPYPGRIDRGWLCTCTGCGNEYEINTANVCRGHRCGHCSGRYTDHDEAIAVMSAKGFRPRVPYPGNAHVGWESECLQCGRTVAPHLANVRFREKSGCRYCQRKAVDPKDAEAFMRSKGWDPVDPYPGNPREPWRCECSKCGKTTTPSYKSAQRGHGCRVCNKQGFDYAGPGFVYVMANAELGAVKIGIFGRRAVRPRTAIMRADGWETYKILPCATGEEARSIEQDILRELREERGLQPYLTNELMPQAGATETFDAELISADELWEMIEETAIEHEAEEPPSTAPAVVSGPAYGVERGDRPTARRVVG